MNAITPNLYRAVRHYAGKVAPCTTNSARRTS